MCAISLKSKEVMCAISLKSKDLGKMKKQCFCSLYIGNRKGVGIILP